MSATETIGITGATGLLGHAWTEHVLSRDPDLRVMALVRPSVAASPSRWLDTFRASHRERIVVVAAESAPAEQASAGV